MRRLWWIPLLAFCAASPGIAADPAALAGVPTAIRLARGREIPIIWEALGQKRLPIVVPDRRGWDLCDRVNLIYIETTESAGESYWRQDPHGPFGEQHIFTDFTNRVDRVILGTSVREGEVYSTTDRGGRIGNEVESVSGYRLVVGQTRIRMNLEGPNGEILHSSYVRTIDATWLPFLPSNEVLLSTWSATCDAHQGHIYDIMRLQQLVIPAKVTPDLMAGWFAAMRDAQ